jgi:hypothetical protein
MKKLIALVCVMALGASAAGQLPGPPVVSMIQLIVNPGKYNGQRISVVGFMHLGNESDLLYFHYEDYLHGLTENAVWFERNPEIMKYAEMLDMNYVLFTGTFVEKRNSDARSNSGAITRIERVSLWSELKHPMTEKFEGKSHKSRD